MFFILISPYSYFLYTSQILYQINILLTFNYLRPEDLPPDEPEPDDPRELKLPEEPDEPRDELILPDEPDEPRDELMLPEDLAELLLEGALATLAEPELFLEANELPLFCDNCGLDDLLTEGVRTGAFPKLFLLLAVRTELLLVVPELFLLLAVRTLLLLLVPELFLLFAVRTVLLLLVTEVFLLLAVRTVVLLALVPEVFLLLDVLTVLLLLFVERLLTLAGSRLETELSLATYESDLLYELPAGCLLYDSL
jgi:hypothetical protein